MNTLFDHEKHFAYTEEGLDVDSEAEKLMRDIFEKYRGKYSPREIGHILMHAAVAMEHEEILQMD